MVVHVGLTTNLKKRVWQHNNEIFKGSFTKGRLPVKLVYWEVFLDKHKAALREKEIKDWRRARSSMVEQFPFKEVVEGSNPSGLTKKEIEDSQGGALATPPLVASALKA